MVAPVIPAITDHEMEQILEAAAEAGASSAGYVLLRLPYEVKDLFREWLAEHYPQTGEARDVPDQPGSRGTGQRPELRLADAGHRPLRGPFADALRGGDAQARPQLRPRAPGARYVAVSSARRGCIAAGAGLRLIRFARDVRPGGTSRALCPAGPPVRRLQVFYIWEPYLRRAVIFERAGGILASTRTRDHGSPPAQIGNPP